MAAGLRGWGVLEMTARVRPLWKWILPGASCLPTRPQPHRRQGQGHEPLTYKR